jgi:3-dehydroquinate dehydratase-2
MAKTIYVLNGPNLNLLGTREPEKYGHTTLPEVEALCRKQAKTHGLEVEFRQSTHEGEIVDWIHEAARKKAVGIVINPAGYTNYSISIMDAIYGTQLPTIEIHITNIHQREEFRHHSFISKAARGVICGFGVDGYRLAVDGLAAMVAAPKR